MVKVEEALPNALRTVTVYVPRGTATVGVPVMLQVVGLRSRPAGSTGETEHAVIDEPPVQLKPIGVIGRFSANEGLVMLNVHTDGMASPTTAMLHVMLVPVPPAFLGCTIKSDAAVALPVGVPMMSQLVAFIDRPAGSAGAMTHDVIEPVLQVSEFVTIFWFCL